MSDVTLSGISVSYDGVKVVENLDMQVSSGEWLSLIGPNGAGKTTVLRAIARLTPFEGDIRLGEQPVMQLGARDLARVVAMLPQEPQMPSGMTVSQYVLLGRSPHLGYLARESPRDHRIVADILRRLSLDTMAARPLEHLSGGERQRVAIARALAQQAPVLLIDEPTTSLDVGRQQEVLELVDQLRAEDGLTVIAAMHELTLAGEPAISEHYRARVRVVSLNGAGHAVVPVRR